jgi:hypothetical protein
VRRPSDRFHEISHRIVPIAVDTRSVPPRIVTETHTVEVPDNHFAHAHQWASEQIMRKWPGATEVVAAQESLIKQHLAAHTQPE